MKFIGRCDERLAIGFGGGTKKADIENRSEVFTFLPFADSFPIVLVALINADRKSGGAGNVGVADTVVFGRVTAAAVGTIGVVIIGVAGELIDVFVVGRLFVAADVKFPFACARI